MGKVTIFFFFFSFSDSLSYLSILRNKERTAKYTWDWESSSNVTTKYCCVLNYFNFLLCYLRLRIHKYCHENDIQETAPVFLACFFLSFSSASLFFSFLFCGVLPFFSIGWWQYNLRFVKRNHFQSVFLGFWFLLLLPIF